MIHFHKFLIENISDVFKKNVFVIVITKRQSSSASVKNQSFILLDLIFGFYFINLITFKLVT